MVQVTDNYKGESTEKSEGKADAKQKRKRTRYDLRLWMQRCAHTEVAYKYGTFENALG